MSREELEAKIEEHHKDWIEILGMIDWQDQSFVAEESDGRTYAEVTKLQWEYKRFQVKYSPDLGLGGPQHVEETVIHELVHVLMDPLRRLVIELLDIADEDDDEAFDLIRELFRLHDERVTTEIAKALYRARYH